MRFDPQVDIWLDVEAFESHAAHDDLAELQSTVALYHGDLLDGFYDNWIVGERYRLDGTAKIRGHGPALLVFGDEKNLVYNGMRWTP